VTVFNWVGVKGICLRGNNKMVIIFFFMFIIDVYSHSRIVLTGNVNTCVFNKQAKVSSKASLLTSSWINR
jgi:hypothetical protein